jgi:hypothetical protein
MRKERIMEAMNVPLTPSNPSSATPPTSQQSPAEKWAEDSAKHALDELFTATKNTDQAPNTANF